MATSSAGLSAAYSTEINDCSFNADLGVRTRGRPQSFCDSVDVKGAFTAEGLGVFASSVTIAGPLTTAAKATFGGSVSVTGQLIVNGVAFGPGLMSVGTPPPESGGLGAEPPVVTGILSAGGTAIDVPAPEPLEPATNAKLGGVIVGSGIDVSTNGTISVAGAGSGYQLPPATVLALGGVKIGANVSVNATGRISVAAPYVLPVATPAILGGVKIGQNLTIDSGGTLDAATQGSVTSVLAGTGLETFPSTGITEAGTVTLSNTGVAAGNYTNANVEVNSQGQIVSCTSGTQFVSFRGKTDVAGVAPTGIAGQFWINTVQGTASGTWTGIVGELVLTNQFVFYTASNVWQIGGISDPTGAVTLLTDQTISGQKTFTQAVVLSGGNPVNATDASTKQYTDTKLPLSGGTITGDLTVDGTFTADGADLTGITTKVQAGSNITLNPATGLGVVTVSANIPIATDIALGGVIAGANISITADGIISVAAPYTLPTASASVLGGVKVGSGLNIASDGTLSAVESGTVSSVTAGTGLETNPSNGITTSGSIALSDTTVVAGTYTNCTIVVDAQGRITSAQSGTAVDDGSY